MRQKQSQLNSWRERKNLLGFAQKKQTNKRQKTMRKKKISQLSSWQEQETKRKGSCDRQAMRQKISYSKIQSESRKTRRLKINGQTNTKKEIH